MRRATSFRLTGLLAAHLAACGSPLSPGEVRELVAGQQRWAARGFSDYAVEMRVGCFCPAELTGWTRVEVVEGQVQRAVLLSTGEVVTDSRLNFWNTIEELFANLLSSRHSESLDDVAFTLHPTLGYPTEVHWKASDNVLDGGGTMSLRNATALP